ncbi:MAG: hypothetical protein IT338_03805 [Thermomicrobiales bacterium]|nr:hypothetical protein [Thermomicrobiales bacterium]
MDGSRFDAWTRRRFGLAAGGLAASLLGLAGFEETEAKRKKKRCKKLNKPCKPKGKKKRCCKKLSCSAPFGAPDNHCCRAGANVPCTTATAGECCTRRCNGNTCFCKSLGEQCTSSGQCCSRKCTAGNCE